MCSIRHTFCILGAGDNQPSATSESNTRPAAPNETLHGSADLLDAILGPKNLDTGKKFYLVGFLLTKLIYSNSTLLLLIIS